MMLSFCLDVEFKSFSIGVPYQKFTTAFMLKVDKLILDNEKKWYVVTNSLGYILYSEIILL